MGESGFIATAAGEIFYERKGTGPAIPLICVHGGPGFTSYYLQPLFGLRDLCPVVLYDQAGCGRSRRGGPRKLFSVEGFVLELEQLRCALGVERIALFGHSFGGLIIGEYALRYPERVTALIFACVSIDIPRWRADSERLIGQLPLMPRMILREGAKTGEVNSHEYVNALRLYYEKHVYGCTDLPESIRRSERESDAETYQSVWGGNELLVTGSVRDYTLSPRLSQLKVPTLFMCGRFDEATPEAHEYFASCVPDAQVSIFEKSAHHPHITEQGEVLLRLKRFLQAL